MPVYLIYRQSDGLVLRRGTASTNVAAQSNAQSGESADLAPPDDVVADGAWHWTAGGYVRTAPAPTTASLIAHASAKLQAIRGAAKSYSSGSTTIASDTTDSTMADWLELQQWAALNPAGTRNWIANDGTVTPLPASVVPAIAVAVGTYKGAVWEAFAAIVPAIHAGTITTTAQIDAANWPG